MKNAEELKLMAHKIVNEYAGRVIEKLHATALEFSIYDALQDAYRKGAEEMREKAAAVAEKRIVHNARLGYDYGWNRAANLIEDEIKSLPLTEGGGR